MSEFMNGYFFQPGKSDLAVFMFDAKSGKPVLSVVRYRLTNLHGEVFGRRSPLLGLGGVAVPSKDIAEGILIIGTDGVVSPE